MKKLFFIICIFFNIVVVYGKEEVIFSKCVDGDTIKVLINDEVKTVRFLAVDTPESVKSGSEVEYYGKESSEYTCNKVKSASKIELEYDDKSDKKDKYGRLLVWVLVDNYLLQDELVSNGYAEVAYLYGDYKYIDLLKEHQSLAKLSKKGIWNEEKKAEYNNNELNNDTKELNWKDYIVLIIIIIFAIAYKNINRKLKKYKKKILN